MSEVLYEQYKDALRRGHVAALRGRLDAAAAAYREAARIAPDRALPYVGLGGVLTRLGRSDEALAAYGLALDRAPVGRGRDARSSRCPGRPRPACRGRRDARPAGAHPRARRAPGRCLRRRAPGARAGRVSRSAPARREPGRPAPDGGPRGRRGGRALERALGVLDSGPGVAPRAARTTADGDGRRRRRRPGRRAATARSEPADPRGRGIARGGRSRRGPPARAHRGHRPPRGRPVPRRDGRLLPGPRHPARRTPTSTCCSPSSTSIAAGAGRRRTSWSCSGGWPS